MGKILEKKSKATNTRVQGKATEYCILNSRIASIENVDDEIGNVVDINDTRRGWHSL